MHTKGVTTFKHIAAVDHKTLLACNNRRFLHGGRTGIALADRSSIGQVASVRMALDFATDIRHAGGDAVEGCADLLTKYFPEEFVAEGPSDLD